MIRQIRPQPSLDSARGGVAFDIEHDGIGSRELGRAGHLRLQHTGETIPVVDNLPNDGPHQRGHHALVRFDLDGHPHAGFAVHPATFEEEEIGRSKLFRRRLGQVNIAGLGLHEGT